MRYGRCDVHPTITTFVRDPERQRLYDWQWRKQRQVWLANHPWCEECLKRGLFVSATDVDHVEPHRGDPVSFRIGKVQSLCHSCHSKKTRVEMQGEGA